MTISGGVTAIRSQAFDQCTNLARITIPGSVTFIGDDVFRGCASLTDVHYGGSESQWGQILCGGYNVGIGAYQEVPFANGGQETAGLTGAAIHYNSAGN